MRFERNEVIPVVEEILRHSAKSRERLAEPVAEGSQYPFVWPVQGGDLALKDQHLVLSKEWSTSELLTFDEAF